MTTGATPVPGRDRFLDAVRAIAVVRVVLWHALGAAALTYIVAAVPAMFFVTGSLLASSLRRPARLVVADRLRRILVPMWALAVTAYVVMAVAHHVDGTARTAVPWRGLVWWLVPVTDPHGSAWEGGYLSAPLWYLRVLLWLVLLSPLLHRAFRRWPRLTVAVPLAGLVGLEWLARTGRWATAGAWRLGDLCLYAVFVVAGFGHHGGGHGGGHDGWFGRWSRRRWLAAALAFGAMATAWCVVAMGPDRVVNDSHPAHLLVGAAWLCALFAARPVVEQVAGTRRVAAVIALVNRRSITIYLWHPAAVVVAFVLLRRAGIDWFPGGWVLALMAATAAITSVFVLAFGWLEDVASRRVVTLWPMAWGRAPLLAGAAVGSVLLLAAAVGSPAAARPAGAASGGAPVLRVPSQPPPAPRFTAVPSTVAAPVVTTTAGLAGIPGPALGAVITSWLAANHVSGAEVAVRVDGQAWVGAFGTDPSSGRPVTTDVSVDIASITKTFTATLVYRAVDRGLIGLDDPLPSLRAVAAFPFAGRVTIRQLLSHRTGIVNYRDTPEFRADPASVATPALAVAVAGARPAMFPPGTKTAYSSTNYLVLGLLLEQLTGVRFDVQLDALEREVGIGPLPHVGPMAGAPNFSTAGVMATVADVARWGEALGTNAVGLTAADREAMTTLDGGRVGGGNVGGGLWGYCPCTTDAGGQHHWAAYGHGGATTQLELDASGRTVIVVNLTESIYAPAGRPGRLDQLFTDLRNLLPGPGGPALVSGRSAPSIGVERR